MARKRPKMPPRIRREIYKRDNYACCHCGWTPGAPPAGYDGKNALYEVVGIRARHEEWPGEEILRFLVIDHIHPLSAGGAFKDPDNLQSLCSPCNGKKGVKL